MSDAKPPSPHPLSRDFVWRDTIPTNPRVLGSQDMADFNNNGFIRVERAFNRDEIAAVTAAIDPFEAAGEAFVREQRGGRLMLTTVDVITFTVHLVTRSPVLASFARHPAIRSICHDLIGPDVRLYWDQAVYKKTGAAQEFPWHQDNGYTFIEPQQYLTLWIPLVDVDEDNGCPWIAPGLHRQGTLAHWKTEFGLKCLETPAEAVPVPARAGDVIAFSSLAPHRTGPNLKAGSVRKAYILQYARDGAIAYPTGGPGIPQNDPARQFSILASGK